MSTHGKLLQHGKPHRREAKSQPDSREGQAGPPGVADGFVVPGKPGNSGGGKGPEFKEVARRGKGRGEWCKPINLPIQVQDPKAATHGACVAVLPCPRAGCGKSARPGSMSGEWKRSVSHRATPRLYMLFLYIKIGEWKRVAEIMPLETRTRDQFGIYHQFHGSQSIKFKFNQFADFPIFEKNPELWSVQPFALGECALKSKYQIFAHIQRRTIAFQSSVVTLESRLKQM